MSAPRAPSALAAAAVPATAFVAKWRKASGSERANYQLFITELCELLGVDKPDPSSEDTRDNAYVFERRVRFAHRDGSESHGFIDCYKRMIGRPVAQRHLQGVKCVVASFTQPAREPAQQLRIDQKFHAGIGSVRLTCVSFAANPNAARMSSRSRSG